jgi:hypothetical protein
VSDTHYSLRSAALASECPECFAEPGGICLSEDGERIVAVHRERVKEFQKHVGDATESYKLEGIEP